MRNNDQVIDHLTELMEKQHISLNELARRTGLAKSSLSRYFNKKRGFPINKVDKFAKALYTTPEEILGINEHESDNNHINKSYIAGTEKITIPIVGEIACGDPITADQNIDGYATEIFNKPVPSGVLFGLICKGDSMEPTIPNGALAIIHEQPTVEDGEIAAVLVDGDTQATLKRVRHQGNVVMLLADNNDYPPIILSRDYPGRIIGKCIRYTVNL